MLGLIYNNITIKNKFFSTSRLLNSGITKTVTSWYVNSIWSNADPNTRYNLFINSDAILNRDSLWSIQGKKTLFTSRYRWRNTPYRKNIAMNVFLVTILCFISYSEHLSVIYNTKITVLSHVLFIAVQNCWITLDRPQCIAICSKFKIASLLLKNSIISIFRFKFDFQLASSDNDIHFAISFDPKIWC